MQEVAEHLEAAAANIVLVGLTWPQSDDGEDDATLDLHVETARQWVTIVVDRLLNWSERAQKIATGLQRSPQGQRPE